MNRYTKIRDFHGARAKGVGSSDIPVLALLMKQYGSTPYKLWRVKTGRDAPWGGNQATWWGHQLEGLVLKEWVSDQYDPETAKIFYRNYLHRRSTGSLKVYTSARHPDYKFALAHADLIIKEDAGLITEAKTHSFFAARRDDDPDFGYSPDDRSQEGIPAALFLQVQWQLFCYGIRQAMAAVLINTNDYREYGPITADKKTQEQCLVLAQKFWWHVENDQEPKPETWADVQKMFPQPTQTTAMVGGEDEMAARLMIEQWHKAGRGIDKLKAKREDIKNALGLWIGENSVLTTAEGVKLASSWKQKNPTSVDLKKLKERFPLQYEKMWELKIITQGERRELRPAKLKG